MHQNNLYETLSEAESKTSTMNWRIKLMIEISYNLCTIKTNNLILEKMLIQPWGLSKGQEGSQISRSLPRAKTKILAELLSLDKINSELFFEEATSMARFCC